MSFDPSGMDQLFKKKSPAIIPRIKQSQEQRPSLAKKQARRHIRRNSNFDQRQIINVNFQQQTQSSILKNYKGLIYEYKQNLSPLQLKQRNLEMGERNCFIDHKKPTSSLQMTFPGTKQQILSHFATFQPNNTASLDLKKCNMEKVCSKMTESIILSSDTLESLTDVPLTLSVNSFDKIRFLGQGKFGQVYLVRHKLTGFICALKIIDKKVVRQQKVQYQISKQIRINNQLKCLNIIDFYGFFDDQNFFYILLEYATQGSVFSNLKKRNRLEQNQILPIARGLCDGLRFMHRMGFIHRDIKPQNIVLQFGVPKICDFGWATDCDDNHLCKSYCGTPLYLSPQMVKKQFYGNSVDIWAAGLVVYELLVGRVPFSIWSEQDMDQIVNKSIQFPEYIDRSYQCQQFIRGCLQKQKYNRMQLNQALKHPFLTQTPQSNLDYEFFESTNKLLNNY